MVYKITKNFRASKKFLMKSRKVGNAESGHEAIFREQKQV